MVRIFILFLTGLFTLLGASENEESFELTPHKKNYIILFGYDFQEQPENRLPEEMMFQISFKKKLVNKLFGYDAKLHFGYTQKSFWQIFDGDKSRPFRETNYNPELYFDIECIPLVRQWGMSRLYTGYEHESNGQDLPISRSWDRFYAQAFFNYGNWSGSLKGWLRIPEPEKTDATDTKGDDNPDILTYYGYGELRVNYDYYAHRFGLFARRNAIGGDLSIPFGTKAYFYTRFFSGYGESLIDYNRHTNRIGVGIQLSR